jgi:hypothetical protein
MVGATMPINRIREGGQAEPAVPSRLPEARTLEALSPFSELLSLCTPWRSWLLGLRFQPEER